MSFSPQPAQQACSSATNAAFTVPSAGLAAFIGTSTTGLGVAFEHTFPEHPHSLAPLFGGKSSTARRGGGGGARSRIFLITELRGALSDTGEPALLNHLQYTMEAYCPQELIDRPLGEDRIACLLHYSKVVAKCDTVELKHLCALHSIRPPRQPTRADLLGCLNSHQCEDSCERSYAVLKPFTSANKGVCSVTSLEFSKTVRKFSLDEMSGIVPDDVLSEVQVGFNVEAVYTDAHQAADGDERPMVQIPLPLLLRHLTIPGLESLAYHHGVGLPGRGKAKKADLLVLLGEHECVDCEPLLFLLTPIKKKEVLGKSTGKRERPAWINILDDKDRKFFWEPFVNFGSEAWPPRPTTMRDVAAAMDGYCRDLAPAAVEEEGCKVCGQLTKRTELIHESTVKYDFALLKEDGVSAYPRESENDPPAFVHDTPVVDPSLTGICMVCNDALKKGKRPTLALANSLWLGSIPDVLKDLTLAERALITRVRSNRCVVRVSTGHAKMVANVISFEHPSMKIYNRLPMTKPELEDVLAVVYTGVVQPSEDQLKRTPVLVRRNRVRAALEWLKVNHRNYADLRIDYRALESYALDDVPIGVWHKPVGDAEGNVLAAAKSVFDNDDELGTTDGPCPYTVHGLTTEKFSTMSSTERKLAAVQHIKNGGAFLAVGHAADPQSIYDNPELYPQMYPWLFPYGFGGVGQKAHKGLLSQAAHLRWLLHYHDKRFQRDAPFLIVAFNHQLIKQNSKGSFMMCKRNNFSKVATSIRSIHPSVLESIAQRLRNGTRVIPDTDAEKKAFGILDQVDVVGTHVNGSLASKKQQRNELWSLVSFVNTPNWFITLSPADNKHPLCIYWASEDLEFKPAIKSPADRLHLVTRNPVACARFFDYVVRLFIVHILGWTEDGPVHGIFGKPAAYYGSVEQQGRLTLHLHLLIWIANALTPQEIRDRLMSGDSEFQRKLVEYIESCQVGEFLTGTKDEVAARVPHIPSGTLRGIHTILEDVSNKDVPEGYVNPTLTLPEAPPANFCRNVDHCDCDDCLQLASWYDRFQASVDDILLRSNVHKCFGRKDNKVDSGGPDKSASVPPRHATGKGCINKDGICTARFPREVFLKTFVQMQTGQLFMKKLEPSINTVTPVITRCSLCNTDTTSLMSGTAVKAIIGYVTDYITKGWLKTHQIFTAMYDVFERDSHLTDDDLKPTQAARKMILRVVNSLNAKMEIGAPMASLYLLQNPDHYTSHDFVIFYWKNFFNKVNDDWRHALNMTDASRPEDSEDVTVDDMGITRTDNGDLEIPSVEAEKEDTLVIHRSGGNYVGKSSVDDYIYRPSEMQEVTLYEWVQCAVRVNVRSSRPPPKHLTFFRYLPDHPMAETHVVACDPDRRRYVVPNFLGPALPRRDTGSREDYCCAMLTLFKPWRSGLDLKSSVATWEDTFTDFDFTQRQAQLMNNFNLKYECYDARDDYSATFKAAAHALGDEDDVEDREDEDEVDGVFEAEDTWMDVDAEDAVDIPGRESLGDKLKYAEAISAIKRAGWSAWDKSRSLSLDLPRLVIDKALGATAWRGLLKQQKDMFKSQRLKALDDMLTFDDEGGGEKVRNDAFVVPGSYLSKSFVPPDKMWAEVMDEIVEKECLNTEQEKAFRIVANHATCVAPDQLLMHLGGMGGTGKSTVIKALIHFFRRRKEGYRFVLLGPTGTSAALIGGTTYHSFLGLRTGSNSMGGEPLSAIEDLKQRVLGVSYVFIDELSMLSCRDLCHISAKCCEAREMYEKPFGGINVILAGDFAQLPPAKGTKLYDNKVSLQQSPGQTLGQQENTIGKIIWLQFTTVVILTQNMRQVGTSDEEKAFQRALCNLRYFACTDDDIRVLRSRVPSLNPSLSLEDSRFRYVSIITARNRTKDQINDSNVERFARETGQEVHEFVSADALTNAPPKRASGESQRRKRFLDIKMLTRHVQTALWGQRPHTSDQVPGTLRLCLGMPVLIRNNEVTELCMTRGQEARVVAWSASPLPHWKTKRSLDVLYLELTCPPHRVKLPHLPENVVPLTKISQTLDARLPNDSWVHISRSQVPVLPNFAMTDYSSQGKTRQYNVVDISECRSFQAIYTCLSRGKSLEGTIILRDFTTKEVRGKLHGSLRQEYRELNYLDVITDLRYKGMLPATVMQPTRWETIDRYRSWKTSREEDEWHPALQDNRWEDSAEKPTVEPVVETLISQLKRKKVSEQEVDEPKRKKRKPVTRRSTRSWLSPAGPLWDSEDWSCPYDAITFVMYSLWQSDVRKWSAILKGYGEAMACMISGFENVEPLEDLPGQLTLVRDQWRRAVRDIHPGCYSQGQRGTDLFQLCQDLINWDPEVMGPSGPCPACHQVSDRTTHGLRAVDLFVSLQREGSVQDMVRERQMALTECSNCEDMREMSNKEREMMWVEVAWASENTRFESHIDVPEWGMYRLAGVIYHGSYHFVARAILDNGKVYVHDGALGGYSTHEGCQGDTFPVSSLNRCGEKKASMLVYVKEVRGREIHSD